MGENTLSTSTWSYFLRTRAEKTAGCLLELLNTATTFVLVWFVSDGLGDRPRYFVPSGFYVNIWVKLKKGENSQVDNPNSCALFYKKEIGAI